MEKWLNGWHNSKKLQRGKEQGSLQGWLCSLLFIGGIHESLRKGWYLFDRG